MRPSAQQLTQSTQQPTFETNLIPIDEAMWQDVLLPFVVNGFNTENHANPVNIIDRALSGEIESAFDALVAEAVRIRRVQLATIEAKRQLHRIFQCGKQQNNPSENIGTGRQASDFGLSGEIEILGDTIFQGLPGELGELKEPGEPGDKRLNQGHPRHPRHPYQYRQGATKGYESPPANAPSNRVDRSRRVQENSSDEIGNSSENGNRVGKSIGPKTITGVLTRPFLIGSQTPDAVVNAYDQYLQAIPGDVNAMIHDAIDEVVACLACSASTSKLTKMLAKQPLPVFADGIANTRASDEFLRHEITWKIALLRKSSQNLNSLRAVFDTDGEMYHPHQLLCEEAPMMLVEFAACLHPGWTTRGPISPTQLINLLTGAGEPLAHDQYDWSMDNHIDRFNHAANHQNHRAHPQYRPHKSNADQPMLMQSAHALFVPLIKSVPALADRLTPNLQGRYRIGGYLPASRVEPFLHLLETHLPAFPDAVADTIHQADPKSDEYAAQLENALSMWREAAHYACRHNLGLIETADLYNASEDIFN